MAEEAERKDLLDYGELCDKRSQRPAQRKLNTKAMTKSYKIAILIKTLQLLFRSHRSKGNASTKKVSGSISKKEPVFMSIAEEALAYKEERSASQLRYDNQNAPKKKDTKKAYTPTNKQKTADIDPYLFEQSHQKLLKKYYVRN